MGDYIITLFILGITSFVMLILGVNQYRTIDKPVNFWSGESAPTNVKDIPGYNKTHGKMWICYGAAIFLAGLVGMLFNDPWIATGILFLVIVGGIPVMFYIHYRVCDKYRK
ncbi:MAG: hypothetical protein IJC41_00550 [Firmicutes bacterium]|nr:hypothetical protein [Bacillota bacterium]MBR6700338.1 hypothetical protein [Bacillota bacterium]